MKEELREKSVKNPEKQSKKPKKKAYDICNRVERRGGKDNRLMNVLRVIVAPILWLMFPFRYFGNKKVARGSAIFIVNHYRMSDVAYPGMLTWEGMHYVAKREIFKWPVLGWFFKILKVIGVNRDGSDVRGMMDSLKCLKNGEKIVIYPEGTRNKTDADFLPFKGGAALMAIKAKAPVIPVVSYKRPRWFRMTDVIVGDPIEFTQYYDKKVTEEDLAEADAFLLETMKRLRAEHTVYLAEKKAAKKGKKATES